MALRLASAADWIARSGGTIPSSTNYTVCGWARARAAGGTSLEELLLCANTDYTLYGILARFTGGTFWLFSAGGGGVDSGISIPNDSWFFWCIKQQGTGAGNLIGHVALATAAGLTTISNSGDTYTMDRFLFSYPDATTYFNGAVAGVKIWDAVLTATEVEAERWFLTPVRRTALYSWSPFVDVDEVNFRDYSGNARDWTEGGTVTFEEGPPVAWAPGRTRRRWWKPAGGGHPAMRRFGGVKHAARIGAGIY